MPLAALGKLNPHWIQATRTYFRSFLTTTNFPEIKRHGSKGDTFHYPEWLILFIAVLAVKTKTKSYVGLHRLTTMYWPFIAKGLSLQPISERQLRDRLKKISYQPGETPAFVVPVFPPSFFEEDDGECRQNDGPSKRAALASKGQKTRTHPKQTQRPR